MPFNRSAHADTQLQCAAALHLLRVGDTRGDAAFYELAAIASDRCGRFLHESY